MSLTRTDDEWRNDAEAEALIEAISPSVPDDPDLHELQEAVARVSCPYYWGVGICNQGCHQEPACQSDEPVGGWFGFIADTATALDVGSTGNGAST